MSCECQYNNENKEMRNILHIFCQVMVIIGLFIFLIIGCAMFRKAEDKRFEESSMFSVVEDNSYWTVYYHKGKKVMWIRNKGGRSSDFEVLIDENGDHMIWEE